MSLTELKHHVVHTLLYYEIFDHPLSANEIFYLFPRNSLSKSTVMKALDQLATDGVLYSRHGYYHLLKTGTHLTGVRITRESLARKRMIVARLMAHVIKRFPFVRAIFISGDLSKGVSNPLSDIDYVIITSPQRLWICRTLLTLFKKVFLLNSKKYFCLNYYLDVGHLTLCERNYYTATEIAHLKPLYNINIYLRYLNANKWIKEFFPNYKNSGLNTYDGNNHHSYLQKVFELPFSGKWATAADLWLMKFMIKTWEKRYPNYDERTRETIFRSNRHESRAYIGNFSEKVLTLYQQKLNEHF